MAAAMSQCWGRCRRCRLGLLLGQLQHLSKLLCPHLVAYYKKRLVNLCFCRHVPLLHKLEGVDRLPLGPAVMPAPLPRLRGLGVLADCYTSESCSVFITSFP